MEEIVLTVAAMKTSNYGDHFTLGKLKEWPDPTAVSLMEALAKEDIDEAVNVILLRESYAVKRLDTYFQHLDIFKKRRKEILHKKWVENIAEPLQQRIMEKVISHRGLKNTKQENFEYYLQHTNKTGTAIGYRYDSEVCNPFYMKKKDSKCGKVFIPPSTDPMFPRQQDEENRAVQCETGKIYSITEFKEMEKAKLHVSLPWFSFTLHSVIPQERWKDSARPMNSKTGSSTCRLEKLTCIEKKYLSDEEKKTTDLSQAAFEEQFHFLTLNQENKRDEKKGLVSRGLGVSGARQHRPRSWAARERHHQEGAQPVERRVLTAHVLGQHRASLQGGREEVLFSLSPKTSDPEEHRGLARAISPEGREVAGLEHKCSVFHLILTWSSKGAPPFPTPFRSKGVIGC
ncbi:PREDICTED: protein FAM228A [Chrysochloris asiatica]|uniref:Protein FAM228A n=1 Tax=Chrysochloris asiatica TaxID=185453 RepID=A0A9B0T9K7_CHRAS|nr:PREDICTED: protein FAM228A [Chrysochloris asiatica]